jgi:hypothetical protein
VALASNVVRVAVLFALADRAGAEAALGTVHPLLGACLLALIFAGLWLLAPASTAGPGGAPILPSPHASRQLAPGAALGLGLGVLTAVFALGSSRLDAFAGLPPLGPPGPAVAEPLDYLRLPDGWVVVGQDPLAWQNLFGADSHSYALTLRSPDGAIVKAQVVTTPDQRRLETFTPEMCRVYHGEDVVGRRVVELERGGVAYLIDTLDTGPIAPSGRLSVLYWQAPFLLDGRQEHARVVLFVVEADAGALPPPAQPGLAPAGPAFDAADGVLVSLARDVSRAIVAASG